MRLRLMSEDERSSLRIQTIENFAQEKVRAESMALDQAREAAEAAWDRASQGEGHVMGRLLVDDEDVGLLWYVIRPEWGQPCLWLYDIEIDAQFRGRGFGRAAMQFLEEEARRHEVRTIGLHVFGHNDVARALYESAGFRETSIVMRKDL